MKKLLAFYWIIHIIISIYGQISKTEQTQLVHLNESDFDNLIKEKENPYLLDLEGFWNFNDSFVDLSKYEEFDHTRYEGSPQSTLEELLEEIKRGGYRRPPTQRPTIDPPVFDTMPITNQTVQLGSTAHLNCRVKNLNNRAISWVRRRDWHILTSGVYTYTNDERFQVIHSEGSDTWILQIKYVQKRDDGSYECQVSTSTGSQVHVFHLKVVVPTAYILGSGEYHIGEGSTISLVCIIENSPESPQYVMWYQNGAIISGESGVSVVTEPGERTHSRLLISVAKPHHSGNYTCQASNTEPDSVYVFVSQEGDNMAAIQRQKASILQISYCLLMALQFTIWTFYNN